MDELIITPFLRKERGFLLRSGTPGGVFPIVLSNRHRYRLKFQRGKPARVCSTQFSRRLRAVKTFNTMGVMSAEGGVQLAIL